MTHRVAALDGLFGALLEGLKERAPRLDEPVIPDGPFEVGEALLERDERVAAEG